MDYPIVPYGKSTINIGALSQRNKIWKLALIKRKKVNAIIEGTVNVCNLHKDAKLGQKSKELRNEIRLFTRGLASNYDIGYSTDSFHLDEGSEQLFHAKTILLKAAYKKLASITHPDKGGNANDFHLVHEAYRNRDLTFLREFWLSLNYGNDLFYQSTEGLDYAIQELQRPDVNLEVFKSNPMFAVNRLHTTGRKYQAGVAMRNFQIALNQRLLTELHYLKEKYHG